jgi:hypothetical protein
MLAGATAYERYAGPFGNDKGIAGNALDIAAYMAEDNPLSDSAGKFFDKNKTAAERVLDPNGGKLLPMSGITNDIARAIESRNGEVFKKDTKGDSIPETMLNQAKAKLPIVRESLPVKKDYRGRPLEEPAFYDPTKSVKDRSDEVDRETLETGRKVSYPKFDKSKDANRAAYRERRDIQTAGVDKALKAGIKSEFYGGSTEERKEQLEAIQHEGERAAKLKLKAPTLQRNIDAVLLKRKVLTTMDAQIAAFESDIEDTFTDAQKATIKKRVANLFGSAKQTKDDERDEAKQMKSEDKWTILTDPDMREYRIQQILQSVYAKTDDQNFGPAEEEEEEEPE